MFKNKVLKMLYFFIVLFFSGLPLSVFAQVPPTTYAGFVELFITYLRIILSIMGALALLYYGWMIYRTFFLAGSHGDDKSIAQGRIGLVYGLIGIAALVSMWGLVSIVKNSFFP